MLKNFLDKLRSKWTLFVVLGMILGFLGGFESGKNLKIVYINAGKVITLIDTLTLKQIVYKHLPAHLDTVQLVVSIRDTLTNTVTDTLILTEVARLDTLLEEGRLKIDYYTVPHYFDFSWKPLPIEVRCKQLFGGTIGFKKDEFVQFSIGAGLGKTWDQKWQAQGLFAGHFYNNIVYLTASTQGYTIGAGRKF